VVWSVRQLGKRGVTIHYGQEVTAAKLKDERPDAAILAAGAFPATPEIPGMDGPNVVDARDLLLGKAKPVGPTVVLGAGYVGMETADFLIARDIGITLVEMLPSSPVGKHTPQADQRGGGEDHPRGDGHPD
jgi:pyruvate/2-oxoglutarate dehydrogenase complex dihydrolipoamide dehydrogenase (E3) component